MTKRVYIYVQDTWSDWEAGYIIAEPNSGRFFKNKGERIPVKTVGLTKDPITTMGGVSITPDLTLKAVTPESSAMLILVGGNDWQDPKHQPVVAKVKELLDANANVAAICGSTVHLPKPGFLIIDLTQVMESIISKWWHGNLITASSAGPLEFARYILQRLEVFSEEALEAWYNYFNTGEAKYFFDLMSVLPK